MSARAMVQGLMAAGLVLAAIPAAAQTLEQRVRSAPDGTVRVRYEAREGVCGTEDGGLRVVRNGEQRIYMGRSDSHEPCEEGPVHLALRVRDGSVVDIDTRVGSRGPTAEGRVTDFGAVAPASAVELLLGLGERAREDVAEDAVFPATLARGVVVWPGLVRLARSERAPRDARKSAVFWLGQEAASAVTAELGELADDGDREVRKSAVFALSRRPRDEGVPALIEIARTHRDAEIRKSALFWLGQTGDPRAIALFEELLRG